MIGRGFAPIMFGGPFFGGHHCGGSTRGFWPAFGITAGITAGLGLLSGLFGHKNTTTTYSMSYPGMSIMGWPSMPMGGYYQNTMYPGLNLSTQQDPLSGLKNLYTEYNFEMIDGKYCARLKAGNSDAITASSASELMSKLGTPKTTVKTDPGTKNDDTLTPPPSAADDTIETTPTTVVTTPTSKTEKTNYIAVTEPGTKNGDTLTPPPSAADDTIETTPTKVNTKPLTQNRKVTKRNWEVYKSPGVLSWDAYLKAGNQQVYKLVEQRGLLEMNLNMPQLEVDKKNNTIKVVAQHPSLPDIRYITNKSTGARFRAYVDKNTRNIFVKVKDKEGKTHDIQLETFLTSPNKYITTL